MSLQGHRWDNGLASGL